MPSSLYSTRHAILLLGVDVPIVRVRRSDIKMKIVMDHEYSTPYSLVNLDQSPVLTH